MAGRPLMLATLLGASIGVPYVVSQSASDPNGAKVPPGTQNAAPSSSWPAFGAANHPATSPPPLLPPTGVSSYPTTPTYPTTATPDSLAIPANLQPPTTARYHRIQDVFRFNVSKEWIYQNWDRKSTGLGDPDLFGIRVALVTGTQRTDLAGALTYLFDGSGQLQHISFRGRTADTTPLVQFLSETYKFQRMEAPAGEQLYQVRGGNDVYSELRTRPESVLLEAAPNGSFGVVLELGRPESKRALRPPVPQLDIPEVASPATPPAADPATNAAENAPADPALVGKLRPATQAEHNQVIDRRWPN